MMQQELKLFFKLVSLALLLVGCTKSSKTLSPLQQQQLAPPPQTVSLTISGYTPPAGRSFQNIFVSNFSVKATQGQLLYMSARDGLPDTLKQAHASDYGFAITGAYSAVSFFSDLLLYQAGITTSSQNLLYCPSGTGGGSNQTTSSSNDAFVYTDSRAVPPTTQFLGLRDCEKRYIGLDPTVFDNDGDGIPDYLELRCGLSPKNPGDANLSIGGDGVTNLQKCQRGIPIDESASSQPNQLFASAYNITVQSDGSRKFSITNIPVLNGGLDNFLAYYITETDNVTQKQYLYTAYSILKAGAAGQAFKMLFWGGTGNAANNYNQDIQLQ